MLQKSLTTTKILWIAHRQMLLDQAAESFQKFAYAESMPNVSSFKYRIVSGATSHDRTIDIVSSDNLLIASKDSLGRNLQALDTWLEGENEIYLVIDDERVIIRTKLEKPSKIKGLALNLVLIFIPFYR